MVLISHVNRMQKQLVWDTPSSLGQTRLILKAVFRLRMQRNGISPFVDPIIRHRLPTSSNSNRIVTELDFLLGYYSISVWWSFPELCVTHHWVVWVLEEHFSSEAEQECRSFGWMGRPQTPTGKPGRETTCVLLAHSNHSSNVLLELIKWFEFLNQNLSIN